MRQRSRPSPANGEPELDRASDRRPMLHVVVGLPSMLVVVFVLEFMNGYAVFGSLGAQFIFITNEYKLSDGEAGNLLSMKGVVSLATGVFGSVLTDSVGVRRTTNVATAIALLGRLFFAFGRSRHSMTVGLMASATGDAMLSSGIYMVALKKLTTPSQRTFAFTVSYALSNLSGALGDVALNYLRARADVEFLGQTFTGTRLFLVSTAAVLALELLLTLVLLQDLTVVPLEGKDVELTGLNDAGSRAPAATGHIGGYWERLQSERRAAVAGYRVIPTPPQPLGAPAIDWSLLRTRDMWRAIACSTSLFFVSMQWTASGSVLPAFLERHNGEGVPIFLIHAINFWGCVLLPPLVGLVAPRFEPFRLILPGAWLMAASPLVMLLSPSPAGAVGWQVLLTIGEVLWSPVQLSWMSSLAPEGREAIFLAFASTRSLLSPSFDLLLGRLLTAFSPNCASMGCRDSVGHFCGELANASVCSSQQGVCEPPPGGWLAAGSGDLICPVSCTTCPGWLPQSHPMSLWGWILAGSLLSPMLLFLLLPFLRGRRLQSEHCDGVWTAERWCSGRWLRELCGDSGDSDVIVCYSRVSSRSTGAAEPVTLTEEPSSGSDAGEAST